MGNYLSTRAVRELNLVRPIRDEIIVLKSIPLPSVIRNEPPNTENRHIGSVGVVVVGW